MVAVATVIIAVVVSIIISRVATVAPTVTGLSRQSARFQARSAQRGDGEYLGAPRGDLPVQAGDTLIIYGPGPRVAELDRRPAGPEGDEAHADAVAEHRVVLNAEAFSDPARQPEDE